MGANQSKPSTESALSEKMSIEYQCTMESSSQDEGREAGYVFVDHRTSGSTRKAEGLSLSQVSGWQSEVLASAKNRLALTALSAAEPKKVLLTREAAMADQHVFSLQIPFEGGPVTNQGSSGRCWLFAATNVFRVALMQKYELAGFELSQAYLFFWDKLEKSNWFLEQVLDTATLDLDGRVVQTLLAAPVSDGGQWDMVRNLVAKYGIVPQALYPDSFSAAASQTLNQVVATRLRAGALELRQLARDSQISLSAYSSASPSASSALAAAKDRILRDIHTVLTLTLGPPPAATAEFTWSFVDRRGRARRVRASPLAFAADIYSSSTGPLRISSAAIDRMVSLVHDPRHPPLSLLTVDRLGNVVGPGARGITYVNVSMSTLKAGCIAMLRAGLPVFFGCDVGKFSDRDAGLLDLALYDYQLGLGLDLLAADKAARLRSGESAMTHAMVLTAVHIDPESHQPVRWRVQNSWGEAPGARGWFLMTDAWMDEFVYQAVVDPRFLPRDVTDVLKKDPIVLPLWDPMGALA
ncbi:bleomycin hydrolase [Grosmannia clavigera kw1407]|uniref:Cysteine proteinase 1, mitochondrial n=1 Tax=Grosmannia clavigera (strain kw1407 / UAMH 11150) TaxID=655863 RepID=F0XJC9_GROCL|nr:bleomycin hydrolase [Grosmannia clavigera kw1407]EFX02089.1 bleomycin hydrolase [Grosmannia clavigera kw1407]